MKKYLVQEYHTDTGGLNSTLNLMAAQGWSVISVNYVTTYTQVVIYEREIKTTTIVIRTDGNHDLLDELNNTNGQP